MSEQITWTHVDKLVRQQLERRGMIGTGSTDAEVAYEFLKFLCRAETRLTETVRVRTECLEKSREDLKAALERPKYKTKKRLEALEKAVEELQCKPAVPAYGPRGQCSVHGCSDPATTPDGLCSGHFY